jgi:ABC-type multidrug transport system fused ATPase/permease subunit
MRSLRKLTALALTLVFLAASAPVTAATDHVVSGSDIQRALRQQTQADTQRATILGLLQRQELRELAARAGLDMRSAESAVRTLEGEELTSLAQHASAAERELAGGVKTITISVVTLLLIVIIIILLVK